MALTAGIIACGYGCGADEDVNMTIISLKIGLQPRGDLTDFFWGEALQMIAGRR